MDDDETGIVKLVRLLKLEARERERLFLSKVVRCWTKENNNIMMNVALPSRLNNSHSFGIMYPGNFCASNSESSDGDSEAGLDCFGLSGLVTAPTSN